MDKRSGRRAAPRGKRVALAVAAAFLPWGQAYALPTGENVVAGDVTVTRPTTQSMQINQGTQKGIVNWQGFSIGASEHVNVNQLNASSVLLNRVVGNNPSEIFGRLTANGQVFLVNNSGVLFAPGASVEVGSLFASSLSITDQNFLNGNYQFYNPGNAGSVVNQGSIVTANGYTALVGPQVRNDGVIVAHRGSVALVAGDRVSLDLIGDGLISVSVDQAALNASVVNTGTIQADGGTVMLKASNANALLDTVINTSGVIRAMSLVERNGEIVLDAGPNGGIVATGEMQAGAVSISGGSFHLQRLVPDPMHLNGLIAANQVNVNVAADITVDGGQIQTQSGQSISAGSLTVRASSGEFATLNNQSGSQVLTVADGMRIEAIDSGQAVVSNQSGDQTVNVLGDGIHVVRNVGGIAMLGKPFVFGVPATDSQTVTTTRLQVERGSVQAGRQDLRVQGDLSVLNGAITSGGDQAVSVSGGSIDVRDGSIGSGIISGGTQTIAVTHGDHINVNSASFNSFISANGGTQTVSITGSGANAIRLGSSGAPGFSQIAGGSTQSITAGLAGEQGSITIVGPAANSTAASIVSRTAPGGSQTIATSGALSITGGTAPNGFASGVFHNGSGLQKVKAANIALQGGSAGNGNVAQIGSFGAGVPTNAGDQEINVAGGTITIIGGAAGSNNRASIFGSGNQTINGNPDITVTGGGSSGAVGNNTAAILANGPTKTQTINARHITVASGAGGINSSASITGSKQFINTTGDLIMTGGASTGQFSGTRIGGLGGNIVGPTDLTLNIGGDLLMTGGSAQFNGASIGSTLSSPAQPNIITINAGGDVVLNSGTAAGARIGSSTSSDELAQGAISITAGGSIQLNGNSAAAPTAIRTLGDVTLSAGSAISEASHGRIEAASLVTTSGGHTSLTGPNQVAWFTASSETGNVSLRNTAPVLALGSMELPGSLTIDQTGSLSIPGTVSALSHAIEATGDVLIGSASAANPALLYASDSISITTPGSIIVRGSDVAPLGASAVLADGTLNFSAGNVALIGGAATATPALARGEVVEMTLGGELNVTGGSGDFSPAVMMSGSNIDLTVGNAVRLDEGSGKHSWARVQTEIKDGVIHIFFPNLAEGGYFVNGVEGDIKHGQTGFFTLHKPVKIGDTLILEYGAPAAP